MKRSGPSFPSSGVRAPVGAARAPLASARGRVPIGAAYGAGAAARRPVYGGAPSSALAQRRPAWPTAGKATKPLAGRPSSVGRGGASAVGKGSSVGRGGAYSAPWRKGSPPPPKGKGKGKAPSKGNIKGKSKSYSKSKTHGVSGKGGKKRAPDVVDEEDDLEDEQDEEVEGEEPEDEAQEDEAQDDFQEEEEEAQADGEEDEAEDDRQYEAEVDAPEEAAPMTPTRYGSSSRSGWASNTGKSKGKGKYGKTNGKDWRRTGNVYEEERDEDEDEEGDEEPPPKQPLPIRERAHEVLPALCGDGSSNVCCLVGETGSGKSTQVPQMLMEEAANKGQPIRIAVTQPRRVAALNLARRVAEEIGEPDIGATVGYRIGGESKPGEHIDFCTTGYLLQLLLNAPEEFGRYTHVVLDEVHERSAESDMLCLVVRLMVSCMYPQTRLVVMSATLQSDLFSNYFASVAQTPPSSVFVGARCYPVTEYYLEDLAAAFEGKLTCSREIESRIKDVFGDSKVGGSKRLDPRHCEKFQGIVVDLIRAIAEPASTILIFLPGISEISSLWEETKALEDLGSFHVFPLHSMIPREEQEMVFREPQRGITNVVLATDIAESSITLPHVVAVIDLGLHRRVDHDNKMGISALATKWISQAAATQRAGRAGRTQPGKCLRMYTKEFREKHMPAFQPAEAQSMPLDRLYLQSKQLAEKLCVTLGTNAPSTAEGLLKQMVQAPQLSAIKAARDINAELGTISGPTEEARITALGRFVLQLPCDMRISRLVWFGVLFGMPADAVVLGSVLSSMDPFSSPSPLFLRDERDFIDKLRGAASARLLFDGGTLSEPLMHRQLFLEWLAQFHKDEWVYGDKELIFRKRRKFTSNFSWHFSLSRGRMEHMISHVQDLALRVFRSCDPDSNGAQNLRELIRGLGYEVNDRSDLAGISYRNWKPFSLNGVFEMDAQVLKCVLAASFSDSLFVGSYGPMEKELNLDPKKSKLDNAVNADKLKLEESMLKVIYENRLESKQTAIFVDDSDNLEGYVELVCGRRPRREATSAKCEGQKVSMVELERVGSERWQPLDSRESAPLLADPLKLPAEFNLLSQYEKCMRDLKRATKGTGSYRHGVIGLKHPCLMSWEWMHTMLGSQGKPIRCEAVFDRKNPTGLVSHVQDFREGQRMERTVVFAVAASTTGSEIPGRCFPQGVTTLSAGHIAFVLATAQLGKTSHGLYRYGFTTSGSLAVLHRSFVLPDGCIDKSRWHLIVALREAIRTELSVEEAELLDAGSWRGHAPIVYDSQVQVCFRDLLGKLPLQYGALEAKEDPQGFTPIGLTRFTIDLDGGAPNISGPKALAPLASWTQLEVRRGSIVAVASDGRSSRDHGHSHKSSIKDRKRSRSRTRDRDRRRERDSHRSEHRSDHRGEHRSDHRGRDRGSDRPERDRGERDRDRDREREREREKARDRDRRDREDERDRRSSRAGDSANGRRR